MDQALEQLREWMEIDIVRSSAKALAVLLVGFLVARVLKRRIDRWVEAPEHRLIARRVTGAVIYGITVAWALSELGLRLSVVLGAAGVLTIALGFAAQTSVSNLISGVFLMAERPFHVGDVIKVSDTTGEVIAIDLLSTKLRTFDNLFVRIPNETMLKANVTNMTHFPIRRYDLQVGVAYKEDIGQVRDALFDVADRNPLCLHEPKPLMIFQGYGDSSVNFQFSVWAARDRFLELRNSIAEEIKRAFDERGIEIPFPHRTVFGDATQPRPSPSLPPRPSPAGPS